MWIKEGIISGTYCSPLPQNNPSSGSVRDTLSGAGGANTGQQYLPLASIQPHMYTTPPSLSLSRSSTSFYQCGRLLEVYWLCLLSKSQGSSAFSGLGLWECITSLAFHMGSGDWTQALNASLVPQSQFCCWMRHGDHSHSYKKKHLTGDLFTTSEV